MIKKNERIRREMSKCKNKSHLAFQNEKNRGTRQHFMIRKETKLCD